MKYYIVQRHYKTVIGTQIVDGQPHQRVGHVRDKNKDIIAYSWQVKKTGLWQIHIKEYGAPNHTAKVYERLFGGVYDLNKPKKTRAECDEHMYYVHLGEWEDPSCQAFRDLVLDAIMDTPLMSDFRWRQRRGMQIPKEPPPEWSDFLRRLSLTTPKRMLTFDRFINGEADITPRPAWPHIRRMYFNICDGLHIDPYAAGFEESIVNAPR